MDSMDFNVSGEDFKQSNAKGSASTTISFVASIISSFGVSLGSFCTSIRSKTTSAVKVLTSGSCLLAILVAN